MTILAIILGLFIVIGFLILCGETLGKLNMNNLEDRRFLEIFDPRSPYLNIYKDELITKDSSEEDTLVDWPMPS